MIVGGNMPISVEAEKYKAEFIKAMNASSAKLASDSYKNDLELIKAVNKAIDELKKVRDKNLKQ
jgi:hypothetical protein